MRCAVRQYEKKLAKAKEKGEPEKNYGNKIQHRNEELVLCTRLLKEKEAKEAKKAAKEKIGGGDIGGIKF